MVFIFLLLLVRVDDDVVIERKKKLQEEKKNPFPRLSRSHSNNKKKSLSFRNNLKLFLAFLPSSRARPASSSRTRATSRRPTPF